MDANSKTKHGTAPGKSSLSLHRLLSILLLFCLLWGLLGCQAGKRGADWTMDDLRLLDPVDAVDPQADVLALYTRMRASTLELRIDLLNIPADPGYDLDLVFITPGREVTLRIPAHGNPVISDWTYGLHVTFERDPDMDTVIVRLNRLLIPRQVSLQVRAYLAGHYHPSDTTAPVGVDAPAPAMRAPVLMEFWDAFPAATPAQALRRWHGAHTGPYGGSHGLGLLLRAVERYGVPITLLDLLNPASLAALQFTDGALAQVQRLAYSGLLLLPESACGQPAEVALSFSREAALDFGLPGSPFVYTCGAGLQSGYIDQFISLEDSSHIGQADAALLIPLPTTGDEQATADGPSLEVRRLLVETAISPDPADLVALGGSLPHSAWGASDRVDGSIAWLAGHPWIHVLDAEDILYSAYASEVSPPRSEPPEQSPWLDDLRAAPENAITQLAWQMSLMLSSPTTETNLPALKTAYQGQVGVLLAAAAWAEKPYTATGCSFDPDDDGISECLLADGLYFAVIETAGGRMTHLFFRDESGAHQVIAPTTQFTIGLSDPSLWQPSLGDAADPGALVGAFSDMQDTYVEYGTFTRSGIITLVGEETTKTFRLTGSGLEVTYRSEAPINFRIPLAVDPQVFFSGSGTFISSSTEGTWNWGMDDGLQVEVASTGTLTADGFSAAKAFLESGEDPDREYPYIHYFPFPFSLVSVTGEGEVLVTIRGK